MSRKSVSEKLDVQNDGKASANQILVYFLIDPKLLENFRK